MKERNKEALLASQKPFKFVAREEQKQAVREKQLKDFLSLKRKQIVLKPDLYLDLLTVQLSMTS